MKSRRAPLNVAQMVLEMNAKAIPNGVLIDTGIQMHPVQVIMIERKLVGSLMF